MAWQKKEQADYMLVAPVVVMKTVVFVLCLLFVVVVCYCLLLFVVVCDLTVMVTTDLAVMLTTDLHAMLKRDLVETVYWTDLVVASMEKIQSHCYHLVAA